MHAHRFAILVALAMSSGVAAARFDASDAAFAPQAGFIKTGLFVARERPAPPAAAPASTTSCAGSIFSELGHGHPDVAGAGFIASHCPAREEGIAPDAALAPSR